MPAPPRATLDKITNGLLGNPWVSGDDALLAARDALARLDVPAALDALLTRGENADAERLLLAAGHAEARERPDTPRGVLSTKVLDTRVAARLPRPRAAYLRVVMAAGRSHRALSSLLGDSEAMTRLRREVWAAGFGRSLFHALHLERVTRDDDVLILGETGTGKESIAGCLLAATAGGDDGGPAPSSTINAAALPETLVESELFGYVKGAFTGATDARGGRIRAADGGCFFLDEVGDLPSQTQVKLLRVLEADEVTPLGSDETYHADVRFVAATHRDLEEMVDAGDFRRDLYQRLAGNVITVPPLRERPEDIPTIGMAFIDAYVDRDGPLAGLVASTERWLRSPRAQGYAWPGNVRELQNTLRSLLLGVDAPIDRRALPVDDDAGEGLPPFIERCSASMQQVNDWYLQRVLTHTEQNFARTARIVGMDRSTVRRHARRLAKTR